MHSLTARFNQLTDLLQKTQEYWRHIAFHQQQLPWMQNQSALVERLFRLPLNQIEHLASNPIELVAFFKQDIPAARELESLSSLGILEQKALPEVSAHFHTGMPGRKWQQLQGFAGCLPITELPLLEWCAGKSHLGFYLQQLQNLSVTALEWDNTLVQQANWRAKKDNISLMSHTVDVLSPQVEGYLSSQQQVVALHACGELHERLLSLAVDKEVQQIHLAPCCYHKRQQTHYQALSLLGQGVNLSLSKAELHTAVMETVTAGATIQRQRKQLQIMRLGFDVLQRNLLGQDQFLALPSLPMSWAKASFEDFCQHCAQIKKLPLPTSINWQHYLVQGQQRFHQVSALDLVRFLFRRPLEVWLALDRALLLQENGYQVQMGTFCPSHITPRNIMLQGILR